MMRQLDRSRTGLANTFLSALTVLARLSRTDRAALLVMVLVILWFARRYIDPTSNGIPVGMDLGDDLAYAGILRNELWDSGRLLTWWSVAWDGIPLVGHPNTQFFYLPFTLPSLVFGTAAGARIAYVFSLLVAGFGMYFLARLLGSRPVIAAWAGLLFPMSGGMAGRIHGGHLQKVLALPLVPLVLGGAFMMGRANSRPSVVFWGLATGLVHGLTFLAGESFLQIFLFVTVPLIVLIVSRRSAGLTWRNRVFWGLSAWGLALVMTTMGKVIASIFVLAETVRIVDPFAGSQHSYWAVVHLATPFFRPYVSAYGWWEYSQYIGIIPVILAVSACGVLIFGAKKGTPLLGIGIQSREFFAMLAIIVLGALWLANAFWYSPFHWLYLVIPNLQDFRVPSRALMITGPAALALSAVGVEAALRSTRLRVPAIAVPMGAAAIIAIWLVNRSWLTPFRWLHDGLPGIRELDAAVAFAIMGLGGALLLVAVTFLVSRLSRSGRHMVLPVVLVVVGIVSLVDVYHATQATAKVGEAPNAQELRRVIRTLQERDEGPFLVSLGNFGMYDNKAVRFEFADQGVPVASNVSPLTPEHRDRRNLIGPAQRVRYRIKPTSDSPGVPGRWAPLLREGDVSVFVNAEASGDAWLVRDGKIQPLNVVDSQPGRFVVQVEARPETTLVVPANAFNGWRVSIDGAPDLATAAFDGYVAIKAEVGEHTYEFSYKAPLLPLVLILGSLPWLLGILLAVWGLWSVAQHRAQVSTSGNDHSISPEVAPLPFGPKS